MDKILQLRNVSAGYEGVAVVKEASLDVYPNDFIGIIGPNGGGKTTLLKTILGLIKPIAGDVVWNPSLVSTHEHFIGYLPQVNTIDKRFPVSVMDVVLMGTLSKKKLWGRYKQTDREKAVELLREMGIEHLANKPIGELSGGQMQRVFLCRALINSPKLLVLDEPNTYVDNKFEKELYEKLLKLNESMAILLVSHDIGTTTNYAKTIACINKTLHYHTKGSITKELLEKYDCPLQTFIQGPFNI